MVLTFVGIFSDFFIDGVVTFLSAVTAALTIITIAAMIFLPLGVLLSFFVPKTFKTEYEKKYAEAEKLKKEFAKKQQTKTVKNEVKATKDKKSNFIDIFNQMDIKIDNEEISNELVKAQQYLLQIKKIEKEFPEEKDKTRKLDEYYLPMLQDILAEYVRIQNVDMHSKEYEERLIKTLKLVNSAMETISIELCKNHYDGMNVDIKTLETLLKKDGLVDEMKINVSKE